MNKGSCIIGTKVLTLVLLLSFALPGHTFAETELNWIEGTGHKVQLGEDLAELTLGEQFVFLNGTDTQTFITENGGAVSGNEIGAVFPKSEDQNWVTFFEYEEPGHIADDEKNDIDAGTLLQSYKEGTEEANNDKDPAEQLFVDDWDVPPHYDEKLHHLTWTLLGHDGNNEKLVNYNVRLLTREGFVSAVLVSDPEQLTADRQTMESEVLSAFTIKEGQRYEDYNESTDKTSEYGLTGLILGGAGLAVAKKAGLLAVVVAFAKKFGVVIIGGAVALWRLLRGRKKKNNPPEVPAQEAAKEEA